MSFSCCKTIFASNLDWPEKGGSAVFSLWPKMGQLCYKHFHRCGSCFTLTSYMGFLFETSFISVYTYMLLCLHFHFLWKVDRMYTFLYILTVGCWQDERERETAIHQRLEKKWLGNIKIPFSTIYLNGKVCLSVFSGFLDIWTSLLKTWWFTQSLVIVWLCSCFPAFT